VRLKALATGLLIFGLALMVAWPLILGPRPQPPSVPEGTQLTLEEQREKNLALARHESAMRVYGARFGLYVILMFLTFGTTMIVALLATRQARQEYREERMRNLERLIESTLEDHRRKSDPEP
jgi:hypothetical protein